MGLRIKEAISDFFSLKDSPPMVPASSRLQQVFIIIAILNLGVSLVISMFMNCPHEKFVYNNLLCKPITYAEGSEIRTFANYMWQVSEPFDYTGQTINITALNVAEFLQVNEGNGYVYEMMLAWIETNLISTNGGYSSSIIYRQRTYLDRSNSFVGRQYCSGDYTRQLNASTDCIGNTTFDMGLVYPRPTDVNYYTMSLANNMRDYAKFPPFECTSCWEFSVVNFKFTDIFSVIQSLFAIYGSLMTPPSITFAILIKMYSKAARQPRSSQLIPLADNIKYNQIE
ncbi:hypothetical protein BGZ49_005528 [Haplosporangium sp. Z 27]|nr:hypothetical protein BGZ49_005528 [Haplosporangium sp. Z 27]